ncbi:LacI family DNA-binding transcriptional regulator [Actinomyces vulturis]|uniref:LacI family DNA-binding transcriptional regulator n=1 Tax=Actinomyces vulturis TaxID=1857645 RepID=UPI00082A2182|nr:LacI family DNA-binding transcriptional regulator [Actinomyces vulturis]
MVPVTRAQVAREAGVSPSTVTYVLTGARSTSLETRQRVLDVVERLGYKPNAAAGTLAARSVRTVGVLFRYYRSAIDMNDLAYVNGVRRSVETRHMSVVLPVPDPLDTDEWLRTLVRSRGIDTAILMDVTTDDEREAILLDEEVPTVLIGTSGRLGGAPGVDADFSAMALDGMKHLARLGHRRVIAVMRDVECDEVHAHHAQFDAVKDAARACGLDLIVRAVADSPRQAVGVVEKGGLIEGATAIVTNTPVAISGVACAAAARGLSIPNDFSMISLGVSEAFGLDPALRVTEYSVDRSAMGHAAGEVLLAMVRGEPYEHHTVRPALLHSDYSTAIPPRR